ncbi:uncharacterized protein LOC144051107 isoform X2 [Vanacampus margaritifer]
MSVEILSVSQTRGNSDTVQDRVGGAKPLHRFINAQPQLVGITMLILGAPFIIMAIVTAEDLSHSSFGTIPPGYMVGAITARITVYIVFMFYVFVGVIILIVMSSLAIAALRSSRSQAIVVMSTTANAAPAELQDEQSAS